MSTNQFTLNQRVIQPQAAMTIIDNETGQIKAMLGGRKTTGRRLYNRATSTRQPGSSLKPLSVYSAALQKSFELSGRQHLTLRITVSTSRALNSGEHTLLQHPSSMTSTINGKQGRVTPTEATEGCILSDELSSNRSMYAL